MIRWRIHLVVTASLAAAILAAAFSVAAQVPPTRAEIAEYSHAHAAAQSADLNEIKRLALASPAVLEIRDRQGRTPLHVATFARQANAVRALIAAGANTAALENGRYDAVTIAAVALKTARFQGVLTFILRG